MGMNVVYNETETREMHFVVNGRDNTQDLTIKGYLCRDHCPEPEPDE